jgi:hypothetical protein
MKPNRSFATRLILLLSLITAVAALSPRMRADTGTRGGQMITLPFTDVFGRTSPLPYGIGAGLSHPTVASKFLFSGLSCTAG